MSFLDNIERVIALYPVIAFAAVFLAGVLSSASPCVLATIPLVVGYVGGYSEGDRRKAFGYSLAFVIGLSVTFTAFGAAAGLFGTMFGTVGGWWHVAVGVVVIIMGGQLMGLYEISLPLESSYRPKQGGALGALLLGLFFGVVSSPCATPALVVLLALIAQKGQMLYGTALLLTYALGHCLLMLAAGTSTGFVEGFAKAKGFASASRWIKRFCGTIITVMGGWFVWRAF